MAKLGNEKKGAMIFRASCNACHTVEGASGGGACPYGYSMWGKDTLFDSLEVENLKKYTKGTKMVFAGIKKPQEFKELMM